MNRFTTDPAPSDRRTFCRAAARWLALAGIGGAAAALVVRGNGSRPQCPYSADCAKCAALATCLLPQAAASKGETH
jgi:hypothetical protein